MGHQKDKGLNKDLFTHLPYLGYQLLSIYWVGACNNYTCSLHLTLGMHSLS